MAEEDEKLERALACHRCGQLAEAAELYQEVLQMKPEKPDALYLFGCLAYQTANTSVARDLLRRAVGVAGNQAEYHHALGLALSALEDYAGAIDSYKRAIELAPPHTRALEALRKAWYGRGCAENSRADFASAKDCFARAVELQPDWLEARHNLGRALYELGMVSEAFGHFKICAEMDKPGSEQSRAMMAVIVPGVPEVGNAGILQTRKKWADRDLPRASTTVKPAGHHMPVRVGYVSSFFQRDNWMKPVWGLINQHDRNVVQVHLFSDCAAVEIQHGYRVEPEDKYVDTSSLSNDEIAALIRDCAIDILVDLNGYSNMRRLPLFAQRAAPVTIGWFNMYATTGMDSFDYLIGDSEVVPPDEERFYSEKILRVEGSYLTFDVSYPAPPVVSRPMRAPGIVFGALASQYKITDEVIEAWSRILRETRGSSLLVKNKQMASSSGRDLLVARFRRHGIEKERLQLEGPEPHYAFLRAYERMDVALDTFPYNGGTTTTEAIWQGVPVVTFYGDRWASRTSASILRAGGLGEFVAPNLDGYVELAARLGDQAERLAELRISMRERLMRSAVCNTSRFARQMEGIYCQLSGGGC